MTSIRRKVFSTGIPLLQVFIVLSVLSCLRYSTTTGVSAFTSIVSGAKLGYLRHTRDIGNSRNRLWASDGHFEIRDFRLNDDETKKIYDLLLRREQNEREVTTDFFDPEGSLDLDVSNKWTLGEAYSKDDGGCFLVAVERDSNDDENFRIVGTLGMISGTQVAYQTSGSSFSEPDITAALRRVCAMWIGNSDDDETTKILTALIRQGEDRALKSGASNLIGLAYPETQTNCGGNANDENNNIIKPTASLLESLGYKMSSQQIAGVTTIQYEKRLSRSALAEGLQPTESKIERGEWIIPATIASLVSLGWLVFNLYSNVFGIEQLWGSVDNGGVGTSISSQYLEQLIQDEKLGRSGIDEDTGSVTVRQWEELSPEELREEQALMKLIQGQSLRVK